MAPRLSNRSLLWGGIRSTLPLVTSVAPFGMLFGALGLASGIGPGMTAGMSRWCLPGRPS